MNTLVKIIVTSILSLSLFSCNFDFTMGVQGDGNVTTKERSIDGTFDRIEVSRGLDVYLTQGDTESLSVQADDNLHAIIITKIEGNTLKIYTEKNISYSEAQKVMVRFKAISKISAASGSDVYTTNTITAEALELNTSSGSDMDLEVKVSNLICNSASGSDLKIKGFADTLVAQASSGSNIDAKDLMTLIAKAKASSGADIKVNTSKELTAKTSSGGNISYLGNPTKIDKSEGVSSSINQ